MQYRKFLGSIASAAIAVSITQAAASAAAQVPNPVVIGPIPAHAAPGDASHDYVYFTPEFDLSDYGYVEEEFFIEGSANRYDTPAGVTGTLISSGHPYRTRIVVRRPKSRLRFNGTVLLEWQNVSAGYELDAHWAPSWDHIVENGYVWVGVSAQRVGVHGNPEPAVNNGLKAWSPVRYGTLDVTNAGSVMDDSLSYDIFSQAAQAIRHPQRIDVLGGLKPRLIFAVGASQSAGRLSTYHNAIHPLHEVVDAFYLLVGGAGLRTDLDVKVFQYLSETDVRSPARRMADSDHFRSWEVAGTAHSSYVSDQYRTPLVLRDFGEQPWPPDCDQPPYSRVKGYYIINQQYDLLVSWVRRGFAPPSAPKLEFTEGEAPTLVRDELGIVRGGIRLPDVEAPTALNTGINSGATFCVLYGTYQPFDAATLHNLYAGQRQYAGAVRSAARAAQRAGYISREAAWEYTIGAWFAEVPPAE
jgi:hypothetical protein